MITFFSIIDEKIWNSDRDATPAQPTVPERLSNTDQILVTSNIKLIKLYKATCKARGNTNLN